MNVKYLNGLYRQAMSANEKRRFEDMAGKDKLRYDSEVATMPAGGKGSRGGKRKKDPNAPKRNLYVCCCIFLYFIYFILFI